MNAAVFIDRDNTLTQTDGDADPADPQRLRLAQGAASAIASLRGLGYKVVILSSEHAATRAPLNDVKTRAVHDRIAQLVSTAANGARIDRFYACPPPPDDKPRKPRKNRSVRRPRPGVMLDASRELGLDLSQSWTVGDELADIEAGASAGTRTILVRPDADDLTPRDLSRLSELRRRREGGARDAVKPDYVASSLIEAVRIIAQQRKPEAAEQMGRGGVLPKRWDAAAVARIQKARKQVAETSESVASAVSARERAVPDKPPPPPPPPPEIAEPKQTPQVVDVIDESPGDDEHRYPSAPRNTGGAEQTLRLILQELRAQRGGEGEFSYLSILAIVLQLIVVVCLLGGLWMGASDQAVFIRWIGAGLLIQLATIAMLLFDRGK